jgi:hypothetical protein
MKKIALFATILAVAMSATGPVEAQQFFTQVLSNRNTPPNPDDGSMDGRGVRIKFDQAPNPLAVKIKDNQNPAGSGDLAYKKRSTWVWTLAGNLAKINVMASPIAPFAATSDASLYWQTTAQNDTKKTCKWLRQNNSVLGDCSGVDGAVGPVTQKDFNEVSMLLENNGSTTVVFTNVQLFYNQSMDNFNLDNFTDVSGVPLTYHDVTLPPGSSAIISFSTPTLDENSYLFAFAELYSNPDDVYGFGEAITVMNASAP